MKIKIPRKELFVEISCILFILLFVYAAAAKMLDFENFKIQLGQSPLLSAFAGWAAIIVPAVELFTAALLITSKYRLAGLYSSFILMVMFTSYIFIILNFSSFVPCSCGGILEKMGWKTHFIFNMFFVVLGGIAVVFQGNLQQSKKAINAGTGIGFSLLSGIVFVLVLFLCSEEIMQHSNPFLRRYHKRAILYRRALDLKYNSYYFAGYRSGLLYLGNYTVPLQISAVDTSAGSIKTYKVDFKDRSVPFRSVRNTVQGNYIYMADGTVPCVFYGRVADWMITKRFDSVPRFTIFRPVDTASFILRNNSGKASAHILGIYRNQDAVKMMYAPDLLQMQSNGIFDTDGMLSYDADNQRMAYVYYYRNEFFTADWDTGQLKRGNTIDTVSKAKIKVATLNNGNRQKMATPPLLVNAQSMLRNNLLFIESRIKGKNEDMAMWKHASVIDVYDIQNNAYILSFPVFGINEDKPRSFYITDTHFYVMVGNKLIIYSLQGILKEKIKQNH